MDAHLRVGEELVLCVIALVDARQLRVVVQVSDVAPRVHAPLARLHVLVGQEASLPLQYFHHIGRPQNATRLGVRLCKVYGEGRLDKPLRDFRRSGTPLRRRHMVDYHAQCVLG